MPKPSPPELLLRTAETVLAAYASVREARFRINDVRLTVDEALAADGAMPMVYAQAATVLSVMGASFAAALAPYRVEPTGEGESLLGWRVAAGGSPDSADPPMQRYLVVAALTAAFDSMIVVAGRPSSDGGVEIELAEVPPTFAEIPHLPEISDVLSVHRWPAVRSESEALDVGPGR